MRSSHNHLLFGLFDKVFRNTVRNVGDLGNSCPIVTTPEFKASSEQSSESLPEHLYFLLLSAQR